MTIGLDWVSLLYTAMSRCCNLYFSEVLCGTAGCGMPASQHSLPPHSAGDLRYLHKPRSPPPPIPVTNNQHGLNNDASSYNPSSSCNSNPVINVNKSCNHSDVNQRSNLASSCTSFTSTSSPAPLKSSGSTKKKIGNSTGSAKNRKVGHALTSSGSNENAVFPNHRTNLVEHETP